MRYDKNNNNKNKNKDDANMDVDSNSIVDEEELDLTTSNVVPYKVQKAILWYNVKK
jgi:hypothetical protein